MENNKISESDEFGLIFDKFKELLDKRDYEGANSLMQEYYKRPMTQVYR